LCVQYKKIDNKPSERDKYYTDILQEYDTFASQKSKRISLLEEIGNCKTPKGKKIGVIAFIADESSIHSSISSRDLTAIGSALMSIGQVDILRFILNSPGGDGITAEKIVEMCRSYCKKFEVIIPNMAKSAATMIALGCDEIVMGYCSEIGPIDAQVPIIIDGIPRYISAQSFINAKKKLLNEFEEATKQGKDVRAILQQIATLNIPFIEQCEKYMQFGRDMVGKYLTKYMFKKFSKTKNILDPKIKKVLEDLSSTETFIVHGVTTPGPCPAVTAWRAPPAFRRETPGSRSPPWHRDLSREATRRSGRSSVRYRSRRAPRKAAAP